MSTILDSPSAMLNVSRSKDHCDRLLFHILPQLYLPEHFRINIEPATISFKIECLELGKNILPEDKLVLRHIHPKSSYIVVGTFNYKLGWIVKLPLECQKLRFILEWKFFEFTAFLLQTNYVYHEIEFNLIPSEPGSLYSMILPYLGGQDISRPISVVNEEDFAIFVKNKINEKNAFERTCGNVGSPIIRQSLALPPSNLLDLAYIDSFVINYI